MKEGAVPRRSSRVTDERNIDEIFEEIQSLVKEAVANAGEGYHTSILAEEILADLRANHRSTYDRWIETLATDGIKAIISRVRNTARTRRSVFASHRSLYDSIHEAVDPSNTQRRLGDMIRSDLEYVSRHYSKLARTNRIRAQAFAAWAKRMPDPVTKLRDSDVSEDEIAAVFTNGSATSN